MVVTLVSALLFWTPALLFLGAYIWLAFDHGTLWLFPTVIHESGNYNFLQTIFYFRHVIRELPITLFYAIASVAAFKTYGPMSQGPVRRSTRSWKPSVIALVIIGVSWLKTVDDWGTEVAIQELLQGYTRDDMFLPGSHWPFHFLSSISYVAGAVIMAAFLHYAIYGDLPPYRASLRWRWIGGCLLILLGLTLVMGRTTDPFLDPRYIGHQGRELFTHLSMTLPLSFGILLRDLSIPSIETADATGSDGCIGQNHTTTVSHPRRVRNDLLVATGVLLFVLVFLVGGTLLTGAVEHARPNTPFSSLVAGHLFEHIVDYVLMACFTLAISRALA